MGIVEDLKSKIKIAKEAGLLTSKTKVFIGGMIWALNYYAKVISEQEHNALLKEAGIDELLYIACAEAIDDGLHEDTEGLPLEF